jgi:uncharacterized protein (DUF427 family)
MKLPTIRRHAAAEYGHEHPTARLQAKWKGEVIADSEHTILLEGNHYFPPEDVSRDYLAESDQHSTCPWKGEASYYDLIVDGERSPTAAWTYPDPSAAATEIRDHVAFWKGVELESV